MKCGCDVDDVTTAIILKKVFPGTINFIGDSANTKEIPIYLVDSISWKISVKHAALGFLIS